jgi:hypothetical protein
MMGNLNVKMIHSDVEVSWDWKDTDLVPVATSKWSKLAYCNLPFLGHI